MDGLLPFPAHDWASAAQVFFLLAIGHALMDYPLQGEFLASCKNRQFLLQRADPARPPSIWIVCMTCHCLLHAFLDQVLAGLHREKLAVTAEDVTIFIAEGFEDALGRELRSGESAAHGIEKIKIRAFVGVSV